MTLTYAPPLNRRAAHPVTDAIDGIAQAAQSQGMTGDAIPSLIMQIMDELRAHGILITYRAGEWCVNYRGGSDATAYLTDDLQDAFERGHAMVPAGQPDTAEPVKHQPKCRRPVSAKAQRRWFIKRHNRRMRGRVRQRSRVES